MTNFMFLLPAGLHMGLLVFLGARMFKERKQAVRDGLVDPKFFKTYNTQQPLPEGIIVSGRHFDNQFQIPVMYFIAMLFAMQVGAVSLFTALLNWVFFGSRVAHSFVHLGQNHPLKRAKVYMVGLLCLIILWLTILIVAAKNIG